MTEGRFPRPPTAVV